MPTLYLHIGMHKTASTAIQTHCENNRERLLDAGLAYLKGNESNHSRLIRVIYDPFFEKQKFAIMRPDDEARFFDAKESNRRSVTRFFEQCAASGIDALISGEGLTSLSGEGIRRLREATRVFDRVIVIAFVRPPQAFVRSMAMQLLRSAQPIAAISARPPLPHYRRRFAPFMDAFGSDNLRFQIFAPARLVNGCPFHTLLSHIDGDWSAFAADRAPRINESLSSPAARAVEAFLKAYPDVSYLWLSQNIMPALERLKGERFVLPPEIVRRTAEAMADDVRWMEEILGEPLAPWDERPSEAAWSGEAWTAFSAEEVALLLRSMAEAVGPRQRRVSFHDETAADPRGGGRAKGLVSCPES